MLAWVFYSSWRWYVDSWHWEYGISHVCTQHMGSGLSSIATSETLQQMWATTKLTLHEINFSCSLHLKSWEIVQSGILLHFMTRYLGHSHYVSGVYFPHGLKPIIHWVSPSHCNSCWKQLPACVGTLVLAIQGTVFESSVALITDMYEVLLCALLPSAVNYKQHTWADRPAAFWGCPGGSHQNCSRGHICVFCREHVGSELAALAPVYILLMFLWGHMWPFHVVDGAGLYDIAVYSVCFCLGGGEVGDSFAYTQGSRLALGRLFRFPS